MGVVRTPLSATYVPEAIARAKSRIARRDVHGCHIINTDGRHKD